MAAWTPFALAATQVIGALDTELKAAFGIGHFDHALLLGLLLSPRRQARMSDLAWALRLAPSNITHRVRRLEKRGLVVRRADPEDGRVVLARLTTRGVRLLRAADPIVRRIRPYPSARICRPSMMPNSRRSNLVGGHRM